VGLAAIIDGALIAFLPTGSTPLSLSSTPDWTVLGFTTLISVLAGVIFGLAPALQSTRPRLAETLKDQAAAVLHGGSVKLRQGLVVAQVALSLLLLVGAGLFLRSLRNLKYTNPGFDVRGLLSFKVEPTLNRYDKPWTFDYYRRLRDRLRTIPGIEAGTLAMVPVLQGDEWDNWVTIEGYTPKQGEMPDPHMQYCSPDYFAAMKVPMVRGRDFTIKDVEGAPKVGIVNQKFAKRYFKGANPLGRHLGMGIDPGTKMDIEIVGVAGNTRYESLSDEEPFELYIPYTQMDFVNGMTVYLRAHGDPANTFNTIRKVVHEVDPAVPMHSLRTLDDQIEISLFIQRLLATLSGVFGGIATLLAALGLYGVMAFMVARRTREIGIRMALGADTNAVIWMVMREVLLLAAVGVVAGVASAWAATRFIQAQLFGIQATDLATMAAAVVGIAAVAAVSGYLPARRATTIDPIRALRWE
jgi:predicted permease